MPGHREVHVLQHKFLEDSHWGKTLTFVCLEWMNWCQSADHGKRGRRGDKDASSRSAGCGSHKWSVFKSKVDRQVSFRPWEVCARHGNLMFLQILQIVFLPSNWFWSFIFPFHYFTAHNQVNVTQVRENRFVLLLLMFASTPSTEVLFSVGTRNKIVFCSALVCVYLSIQCCLITNLADTGRFGKPLGD